MISGIQESFVDYPGHPCVMLFFPACPWDCPGCYNKASLAAAKPLAWDYVRGYLLDSMGLAPYVTLSGGEPTCDPDLFGVVRWAKDCGFSLKLDTNGIRPEVLADVLPDLSVVAMDLKDDPGDDDRYKAVARADVNVNDVRRSIDLLSAWYAEDPESRTLIYRTTLFTPEIDPDRVRAYLRTRNLAFSDYVIQDDVRSPQGR